ncbi:hypothetical protein PILCRDRAFT_823540 [Piloderma croceum F 1598]|uniref:Uncharacterized protein n=1 Tax=Piloderma croceum (strain F 1598) TaxID=765440 RepID=A0A0C3FHL8_PILCF|nr:hypothetical protein PILCRDRAFT_823540 [Piloderma croceum F 1598]
MNPVSEFRAARFQLGMLIRNHRGDDLIYRHGYGVVKVANSLMHRHRHSDADHCTHSYASFTLLLSSQLSNTSKTRLLTICNHLHWSGI